MDQHKDKEQDKEQQLSEHEQATPKPAEEQTVDAGQTEQVEQAPQQRSWLRRYGFSLVVLGICIVLGYFILAQQNETEKLSVLQPGVEFSYPNIDGSTVTLSNTNGKVRLLYFFFANCPDVCPPSTAVMSKVQDELKEDGLFGNKVEFLSVTIDPNYDTVEVLTEYADRFDADLTGWKFLRGDEAETFELAKKFGVLAGKDPDGNFFHMNYIVLLDKEGQVRDWISANDYIFDDEETLSPSHMTKKIKSLL